MTQEDGVDPIDEHHDDLTPTERKVLRRIAHGESDERAAEDEGMTVTDHRMAQYRICECSGHCRGSAYRVDSMIRIARMRLVAGTLIAATALAAAPACSGGESESTVPPSTPVATGAAGTPEEVPGYQRPTRIGITGVDAVLEAFENRDANRLANLIDGLDVPCRVQPLSSEPSPKCEPGVADGTPAEAVPVTGCEGRLVARTEIDEALRTLVDGDDRLFAIYQGYSLGLSEPFSPIGEYAIVLATKGTGRGEQLQGHVIHVTDGTIVRLDFACGEPLQSRLGSNPVLPPRQ